MAAAIRTKTGNQQARSRERSHTTRVAAEGTVGRTGTGAGRQHGDRGSRAPSDHPLPQVQFQHLDLSRLASVHQFSSQLKGKPVDVLINNAGLMASTREVTGDGFETTWQVSGGAPPCV